ncbi:hypothetical protein FGB62_5g236 [Gracilaria domingensis]|nr:hypothetical protein FGB62_5g236 [Gracilaria domingensis]
MGRQPPTLGADENPPSPLPPPTPYTEPPTPLDMPESPVALPRSLSPRLRPLRRLAARKDPASDKLSARSRRHGDGATSANSTSPSPPPAAPAQNAPHSDLPQKEVAASEHTPPDKSPEPRTRSLAEKPPEPQIDASAPADISDAAAAASPEQPPTASPPSAPEHQSDLPRKPASSDMPPDEPEAEPVVEPEAQPPADAMNVDNPVSQELQTEQEPPHPGKDQSESAAHPSDPSQQTEHQNHPALSRERDKSAQPATRRLALSGAALHEAAEKTDLASVEPTLEAASNTEPPAEGNAQVDEAMPDIQQRTSPDAIAHDKPDAPSPPNSNALPDLPETGTQVQDEITPSVPDKPRNDQPTSPPPHTPLQPMDTSAPQPTSGEVIDLADGATQPNQVSSKTPRPRQLAVRSDFNKFERRQLAVRTQEPEDLPHESSATPLSSSPSPDVSKSLRGGPRSRTRKRHSSPDEFEGPTSRYGTRSATKETGFLPNRPRTRRYSEPAITTISERTRSRKKSQIQPVKSQIQPVKGDRLRVLWHIDLLYYEGVVDSVLHYRGKQFFDLTYDSGEKEFYLDLSTRKWRFADGRDGNDSDDSIPEPQGLPDYAEFPKVGDKVLVMWHVDAQYYPGVVKDILKVDNGWFYDVDYDGGDREFFLDLHVRKWKYALGGEAKKRKRKIVPPAKRAPREKIKRAARKSTGGGNSAYEPPPSSSMATGDSLDILESSEHQPSRSLRKVESLLEDKERQEQERRSREEQKKRVADQRRMEAKRVQALAQEREEQLRRANIPKGIEREQDSAVGLPSNLSDVGDVAGPKPSVTKPSTDMQPTQAEQLEPAIVLDLPELEDETFENMMEDIGAPLAPSSTKKRPRSPVSAVDDDEQAKRKKGFSSAGKTRNLAARENLDIPSGEDFVSDTVRNIGALQNLPIQEINVSSTAPSPPQRLSSQHQGELFASIKQSHLPPNAAPPARKTVQQRARSAPRTQLAQQHVLQSEPDFIPRPRSVSRARSRSRRPTSRRRTTSPHSFIERRRLMSKDKTPMYTPASEYGWMRPSAYLSQKRVSSAKKAKTTVADIVSVSGLVAKRWIEENTKQISANLKNMENELSKMKATHAKHMKTEKMRQNRATARQPRKPAGPEMSDEEKDAVLGGVGGEFMGLIKRYRTVVERREQVLIQQFARFRKTLGSQNSKLVSTGKQLEKLDIRGLKALDNLQPITRSKLDIPPPLPPRQKMNLNHVSPFKSPLPLLHQDTVQVLQNADSPRGKPVDRPDKSDAVAKSLRRKLADLVTRSDWLGEEVKRLQNRERFLVKEKREAIAELNKMRSERSSPLLKTTPSSSSRALPPRSTSVRTSDRPLLKFSPAKPVGIVKNRTAMESRSSGRSAGCIAPRKNLPPGNMNYKPPMQQTPSQSRSELKSARTRSPTVTPAVLSKSVPMQEPPPVPKPATFVTPTSNPMEDVTKPEVSGTASTEIEKGSNFTDELGKSMDKQAWELLALIFTIWLLQDEGRSEPPKEPGEKMDSWVRACVRNCLKHARIYLEATSGITTARRSLMHDVDGENVYVKWILGDSDENFERARSNYSLWEPTLLDVEWLAEKRVLLGLSICYKKAWGETSARQYETTLMYAKAIAHKAVSNFELYMPHTIVLGATQVSVPSATGAESQSLPSQPGVGNLKHGSLTVGKDSGIVSGPVAVTEANEPAAVKPVTQPSNVLIAQPSLQGTSLPLSGRPVVEQPLSVTSSQLEATKTSRSGMGRITAGTSLTAPVSEPIRSNAQSATDTTLAATQNITPEPGSTDPQANLAGHRQPNTAANLSPVVPPVPSPASRAKAPAESTESHEKDNAATTDRPDPRPSRSTAEDAVEERKIPNPSDNKPAFGSHEGDKNGEKGKISLGTSASKSLNTSGTPPRLNVQSPSSTSLLAKDVNKGTTSPTKSTSFVNEQGAQASTNDSQENRAKPGVAERNHRNIEQKNMGGGGGEKTRNSSSNGNDQLTQADNVDISLSKQSAVGSVVSMIVASASQSGSNEKTIPSPSPVSGAPHLSSATIVTSMGANVPAHTPSAPRSAPSNASSIRSGAEKGTNVSDESLSKNTEAGTGPKSSQPAEAVTKEFTYEATDSSTRDHSSSAVAETTKSSTIASGNEKDAGAQKNSTDSGRTLRSSKPPGSRAVGGLPSQSNTQGLKPPSPSTKRGSKAATGKGSGARGRKQTKSARKGAPNRSRQNRTPTRPRDAPGGTGSPRVQRKGARAESEPSVPQTAGMVGLMRLPGASPTVSQTENRVYLSSSIPTESLATRQPVGMKRLSQTPASTAPQRRILSGVDPAEFDSLPSPIPRRQGLKGVSDDQFSHAVPYTIEQQSNPYAPNGKWGSQQPVQRKGYKSLSLMPPMAQQSAPITGHPANPFDARAVASPFEYNRTGEQVVASEARAEVGQESGYHVAEQVDVMNPPTPAALSALDYGVEPVHRDPVPSTTEFQERFDRGYDPYRSQIGHIVNTMPREGFNATRNVLPKEYGKRAEYLRHGHARKCYCTNAGTLVLLLLEYIGLCGSVAGEPNLKYGGTYGVFSYSDSACMSVICNFYVLSLKPEL